MHRIPAIVTVLLAATAASSAHAQVYRVTVTGTVGSNIANTGTYGDVQVGDPAHMTFTFDGGEPAADPTDQQRGFPVDNESFLVTVGGVSTPLRPSAAPFFILRDMPQSSSFSLVRSMGIPYDPQLDEIGVLGMPLQIRSYLAYDADTLLSTNAHDAVGVYDLTGQTASAWAIKEHWLGVVTMDFATMTIEPEHHCPGDVNHDGTVDVEDIVAVFLRWGACSSCAADVDADGLVSVSDLAAVIAAWGGC